MAKKFTKKETKNFLDIIQKGLQEKNVDLFYKMLPTKDELKILKVPNVNKFYKKQQEDIPEFCGILFEDLKENQIDTSQLEVGDIDVDMTEYNGISGTKLFTITFDTGDMEFLIIVKEVMILDKRLIWGGRGIDFELKNEEIVTTQERISKKEVDGKWIGTHTVEIIENLGGYLEYAHKEAVVYDTLHVEGNLDLDNLCNEGIYTLVVKGDLTVTGDIINTNSNTGTTLSVEGTTRANNMIAGGSILSLNEVIIKDFTIGFYNDGILSIEKLNTDILISNDHHTEITDASEVEIYIDYDEEESVGKVTINDMEALLKHLAQTQKFIKPLKLIIEEDKDEFYLDYDVLNEMIVKKKYDTLKRKIFKYVKN